MAVTEALDTTAPLGSTTVPRTLPAISCAEVCEPNKSAATRMNDQTTKFFMGSPSSIHTRTSAFCREKAQTHRLTHLAARFSAQRCVENQNRPAIIEGEKLWSIMQKQYERGITGRQCWERCRRFCESQVRLPERRRKGYSSGTAKSRRCPQMRVRIVPKIRETFPRISGPTRHIRASKSADWVSLESRMRASSVR